jgi:hypothetical protein
MRPPFCYFSLAISGALFKVEIVRGSTHARGRKKRSRPDPLLRRTRPATLLKFGRFASLPEMNRPTDANFFRPRGEEHAENVAKASIERKFDFVKRARRELGYFWATPWTAAAFAQS